MLVSVIGVDNLTVANRQATSSRLKPTTTLTVTHTQQYEHERGDDTLATPGGLQLINSIVLDAQ
jgi:hypothetical protein